MQGQCRPVSKTNNQKALYICNTQEEPRGCTAVRAGENGGFKRWRCLGPICGLQDLSPILQYFKNTNQRRMGKSELEYGRCWVAVSSPPTGSINSHLGMTKSTKFLSSEATLGQKTYPVGMEQTRKVMQKAQRRQHSFVVGSQMRGSGPWHKQAALGLSASSHQWEWEACN